MRLGLSSDAWPGEPASDNSGKVSVSDVPQADIPITMTIRTNSDIRDSGSVTAAMKPECIIPVLHWN